MKAHALLFASSILLAACQSGCGCSGMSVTTTDGGTGAGGGGGGGGGAGGGSGGGIGSSGYDGGVVVVGLGPGGLPLDAGNGSGVKLDPNGNIVLEPSKVVELHFLWVANADEGTVSKFDSKTGNERARYYSVVPRDGAGAVSGAVALLRGNGPNSPSRTAVDLLGDVWVANRAYVSATSHTVGSVTKIANDAQHCVDRNGNGRIDTSHDVNGDGVIDPATATNPDPAKREMIVPADFANPSQYDECVLFSTPLGNAGAEVKVRALAISRGESGTAGAIWAGHYQDKKVFQLDPANGKAVRDIALAWGPYGAAVDAKQRLWLVKSGETTLALVNADDGTLLNGNITRPGSLGGAYGIAVDPKNRVWLGGWWSGPAAHRYDHDAAGNKWQTFTFNTTSNQTGTAKAFRWGRGIAADQQGLVWMSSSGHVDCNVSPCAPHLDASQLIAFNADTGAIRKFQSAAGPVDFIEGTDGQTFEGIGVGLDADGHPWVNNKSGNVMRVHRDTGALMRSKYQRPGLYTYSDFTGYQLRQITAPGGLYWFDYEGCDKKTRWLTVQWDATVTSAATVELFVRVAATRAALSSAATQRYGPFRTSPTDLEVAQLPTGQFLRLEFALKSTDPNQTPVLKSFSASWRCDVGIN